MEPEIVIYGKDTWPHTQAAREAYRRQGAKVEYFNVLEDADAMAAMLRRSGNQRKVPVIVRTDTVEVGFEGHSWVVWRPPAVGRCAKRLLRIPTATLESRAAAGFAMP